MPDIHTIHDRRRGCGWRQPGGLYLVGPWSLMAPCGKLPLRLTVCPCCGQGVKPSRGWTWVDGARLFAQQPCPHPGCHDNWKNSCSTPGDAPGRGTATQHLGICRLSSWQLQRDPRLGLLWVGVQHYTTPGTFLAEAQQQGFSRRIARVPRGFVPGRHWVLLAHRRVFVDADGYQPGIFACFRPAAVDYVVRDQDPPDKLQRLEDRGIRLVRVSRVEDSQSLFSPKGV